MLFLLGDKTEIYTDDSKSLIDNKEVLKVLL